MDELNPEEDDAEGEEIPFEESGSKKSSKISDLSNKELEIALQAALDDEDYEKASQLRDELNSRNQN